jgi:hypothetical protein
LTENGTLAGQSPAADGDAIYMFFGDGHGTLSPGPETPSSANACNWLVGDFNDDGRADLVTYSSGFVGGEASHIVVRPGESNGEIRCTARHDDPAQRVIHTGCTRTACPQR